MRATHISADELYFHDNFFQDTVERARLYSDMVMSSRSLGNTVEQTADCSRELYRVLGAEESGSPFADVVRAAYENISANIPSEIKLVIEEFGLGGALGVCALGPQITQMIREASDKCDPSDGEGEEGERQEGEGEGGGEGEGQGKGGSTLEQAQNGSKQAAKKLIEALKDSEGSDPSNRAYQILQNAPDVKEAEDAVSRAAGTEPGMGCSTNAIDLAQYITHRPNIKKSFAIMGRLATHFNGAFSRNSEEGNDIPDGTTVGDNVARLATLGRVKMSHPKLRRMFKAQLAESAIEVQDLRGSNNSRDGNVVILVDESGSMSDYAATGETYIDLSKAVAFATVISAGKRGRKSVIIPFDSNAGEPLVFKNGVTGPISRARMSQYLLKFSSGGTRWYAALHAAVPFLDDNTDIMLITDGHDRISKDMLNELVPKIARTNSRVFMVLLGEDRMLEYVRQYVGNDESDADLLFNSITCLNDSSPESLDKFARLFSKEG